MTSKHDIGWEHAELVGGSRRTTKCKYCGKVIHGGITRLKQHIADISGQVEGCPRCTADSRPYYQSMIDTILEAGSASRVLLDTKLEIHIWKRRCKSLRTRKPIINFMIYCDRSMIYHSSVDTTNIPKTTDYIFSLMDKVVEEVGEENVVQVVTDNEASFKAAGELFVDGQGEFRSALIKKAINQSLPGLPINEEGRERDVDSRRKGKASRTISSSSSSDDGDNRGKGYSNTGTRASDSYGYDQSSSSSSIAYRGFGYYQYGVDPEQPSKPYFPDYGSSSQSSHPTYSSYEQLFQPYPHYGNCHPNFLFYVSPDTNRYTETDTPQDPRVSDRYRDFEPWRKRAGAFRWLEDGECLLFRRRTCGQPYGCCLVAEIAKYLKKGHLEGICGEDDEESRVRKPSSSSSWAISHLGLEVPVMTVGTVTYPTPRLTPRLYGMPTPLSLWSVSSPSSSRAAAVVRTIFCRGGLQRRVPVWDSC
ncbi:hypothetical protein CK203_033821 [Vitis vinifera]|uniref:BED-type domain-containing protein n=1 Tax=Vitis vinifera TaxID=29760 RepID=A0A438IQ77_VITVI|nr:hypothetical protein CK203_033821 [Vitis vinifera]